jgi:hypothetical protein
LQKHRTYHPIFSSFVKLSLVKTLLFVKSHRKIRGHLSLHGPGPQLRLYNGPLLEARSLALACTAPRLAAWPPLIPHTRRRTAPRVRAAEERKPKHGDQPLPPPPRVRLCLRALTPVAATSPGRPPPPPRALQLRPIDGSAAGTGRAGGRQDEGGRGSDGGGRQGRRSWCGGGRGRPRRSGEQGHRRDRRPPRARAHAVR